MKRVMIDQVELRVWAGNGGRGVVSFRREKFIPKGGPDGGDGGNGGSVYLMTSPHVTTLLDYTGKDLYEAQAGGSGKGRKMHGKDAEDLTLMVPVGTEVWEDQGEAGWVKVMDLSQPGEKALIARGGAGGRGNTAFKSSINTTPQESEPGEHGERKHIRLELKLLADVGLVGLPNAGKSTLLSVLTAARPEIANYPFTTITPNLGVMIGDKKRGERDVVIADIPGLIEQAHEGKGLGIDFLRHIERCQVLVYVISPTDEDLSLLESDEKGTELAKSLWHQFDLVRHEVQAYGKGVDEKKRLVVINKADLLTKIQQENVGNEFKKGDGILLSAATNVGIDLLKKELWKI